MNNNEKFSSDVKHLSPIGEEQFQNKARHFTH